MLAIVPIGGSSRIRSGVSRLHHSKENGETTLQNGTPHNDKKVSLSTDANDADALFAALEQLMPNAGTRLSIATAWNAQEYIRQLDLLKMNVALKLEAVNSFLTAEWMQERWLSDHVNKEDIDKHSQELIRHYDRVWGTCRGLPDDTASQKIEHGRHIYGETCHRVENIHTKGVPFVRHMNEGVLHHKVNDREIGWHPDWRRL